MQLYYNTDIEKPDSETVKSLYFSCNQVSKINIILGLWKI